MLLSRVVVTEQSKVLIVLTKELKKVFTQKSIDI